MLPRSREGWVNLAPDCHGRILRLRCGVPLTARIRENKWTPERDGTPLNAANGYRQCGREALGQKCPMASRKTVFGDRERIQIIKLQRQIEERGILSSCIVVLVGIINENLGWVLLWKRSDACWKVYTTVYALLAADTLFPTLASFPQRLYFPISKVYISH